MHNSNVISYGRQWRPRPWSTHVLISPKCNLAMAAPHLINKDHWTTIDETLPAHVTTCKEEPSDVAILLSEAPNRIVQDLEKASGLLLNYIFYLLTPVESATNSYKSVYMHNTCSFHQEVASTSGLHYDIYKNRHAFIRTNAIVDTAIQGQSGSL